MNERLQKIDGPLPQKQKKGEYIRHAPYDSETVPLLQKRIESMRHERLVREEKAKILALAIELSEVTEGFPFGSVEADEYAKMKATELEFPGYTTPIAEILQRMQIEGMKVVLGKNPESGNIYILPFGSTDIENDSISPRQLCIAETPDLRLQELVQRMRDFRQRFKSK